MVDWRLTSMDRNNFVLWGFISFALFAVLSAAGPFSLLSFLWGLVCFGYAVFGPGKEPYEPPFCKRQWNKWRIHSRQADARMYQKWLSDGEAEIMAREQRLTQLEEAE